MNGSRVSVYWIALILPCACSTSAPPMASSPAPETAAAAMPATSASAAASAPAAPGSRTETASVGSAGPASSAGARPKDKLESGGHPLTIYSAPTQPVTVGQDGAIIRTENGAELRILAGAIAEPRNVLIAVDRKARGTTGKVGDVYELPVQVPAQKAMLNGPSQAYDSYAEPFILKLPLPAGTKSANLAVERVEQDAKTKKLTSSWTVLPMARMETADTGDKAVFELKALPGAHVHLTTTSPTGESSK